MAAAVSIARTFGPLYCPVQIPAYETWVAPAAIDRDEATERIRALVQVPATLDPRLVYVPFWRVKVSIDAECARWMGPRMLPVSAAGNTPLPIPSAFGRAGMMMICARTVVPYTPRLPAMLGGTGALEVQRSELLPLTNAMAIVAGGEIVDADVDALHGEQAAADAVTALLRPSFLPVVESTLFVLCPLWYASYAEDCYVLLSARDGGVVSSRAPRPPTLSERVRRFFAA